MAEVGGPSGGRGVGERHRSDLNRDVAGYCQEKQPWRKLTIHFLEEQNVTQSQVDDAISERDEAFLRMRKLQRPADSWRSDKADVMMRAEIDRLRAELQKSEESLSCH